MAPPPVDEKMTIVRLEDSETSIRGDPDAGMTKAERAAEKKLLRKIDLHVVPILWILYLLAFLDRTNIGNAKIQGMTEELDMSGQDYNIALFTFFITYIIFEVPSNIIIKRVSPSTWLSSIMGLWGVVTIGQGLVKNFEGLVALRVLLGLFEAGFFPGALYLITMWYKRYELQWRVNLFFSGAILAGAFSGLLAYGIANLDGTAGYGGWSWIFIIEGLLTVVAAIGAKFLIPDWPETATFLTEEEKARVIARLAADVSDAHLNRLDKTAAKRIFSDWKIYLGIFMYMGVLNTGYASSFFIPSIIRDMGYTSQAAQVRSIPVFVVAAITTLLVALCSDRARHRFGFVVLGICIATTGYALLLSRDTVPVGVRYTALFFVVCGCYCAQPIVIAWIQNNSSGHYKRSISSAMIIGFGNLGGITASNVFIATEAPYYTTGYTVSLAMLWMSGICCMVLFFGLRRENKRRDRGDRDWRLEGEHADNLGDDHPNFRFTY